MPATKCSLKIEEKTACHKERQILYERNLKKIINGGLTLNTKLWFENAVTARWLKLIYTQWSSKVL